MSLKTKYGKIFNTQLTEFLSAVTDVFPDNVDIATATNGVTTLQKMNSTAVHKMWYQQVTSLYRDEILRGDISFFIAKDYTQDIDMLAQKGIDKNSDSLLRSINGLKKNICELDVEEQQKCMKYVQNLTQLTILINEGNK